MFLYKKQRKFVYKYFIVSQLFTELEVDKQFFSKISRKCDDDDETC